MICDTCHGTGWQWRDSLPPVMRGTYPAGRLGTPCPDCGGSGIVHCCEGDRVTQQDEDES